MIREQKNKFWLTLILILSLSFSAVALGVANIFTFKGKDVNADATNASVQSGAAEGENWVIGWQKNGADVEPAEGTLNIGTLYGGTTIKVETATDLQSDASWDSEFKISISHSDASLKDNEGGSYNRTYQPKIANGYRLVGFRFYADGKQYLNTDANDEKPELFQNGESATTEQIDPTYTGKITIKAVCERITYNLSMYYSQDGENWKQQNVEFDVSSDTNLEDAAPDDITLGDSERAFDNWAILAYNAKTKETLVTRNEDEISINAKPNIIFTLKSKSGDNATIESGLNENLFDSFKDGEGNRYFYVDKVTGYSSTLKNFDHFPDGVETEKVADLNPEIRATWSYVYNGLINNENNHHNSDNLIGAVSSDDKNNADSNYKIAKLKIAKTAKYAYKFMTNNGIAFAHKSDFSSTSDVKEKICSVGTNNYYVYNYGREITGWTISFENNGNKYLKYNKDTSSWSVDATANAGANNVEDLTSTTLSDLCIALDSHFISGYDPDTKITIEPVWSEVKINLVANYEMSGETKTYNLCNVTYNGDYAFSDNYDLVSKNGVFTPAGKFIYYYTTVTGGNVIAKKHGTSIIDLKWNYVNIAHSSFSDYNAKTGTYTLNVEPYYVNNIHKLNLIEDADHDILYKSTSDSNYLYQLDKPDKKEELTYSEYDQYQFANANGINKVEYTILSQGLELDKAYDDYESGSIEEYIENTLIPVKDSYEGKIADGSLNILRKVYTTNSGASVDSSKLILTSGLEHEKFYIYLANEQKSGNLPVFVREYYDLIAWDNEFGTNKFAYQTESYTNYQTESYIKENYLAEFESYTCNKNHDHATSADCTKIRSINNDTPFWSYNELDEDGNLEAHYYRKSYLVDLNTVKNGVDGRYGYIYIDIVDNTTLSDRNGKFIAVFENGEMKYYEVSSAANINVIKDLTPVTTTHPLIKDKEGTLCIVLYAGCDLTIKASCVDYFDNGVADNVEDDDLTYADMVGYYLKSITAKNDSKSAKDNLFNPIEYSTIQNKVAGTHSQTITAAKIESLDYATNTKITIDAHFDLIDYNIVINLKSPDALGVLTKNPFAGRIDCSDKSTTEGNATITFVGNIENWSEVVEYIANAGYTLKAKAITTTDNGGVEHILLSYDLTKNTDDILDEDKGIVNKQDYSFNLNGEWLIKYFYTNTYDATIEVKDASGNITTEAQKLELDVNTELFEFKYIIQIVDENGELSTYQNGTMKLNGSLTAANFAQITIENSKYSTSNNGKTYYHISRALVANEFEQIEAGKDFYVIKICKNAEEHVHDDSCVYKNYVIISSSLSQISSGNDHTKDYNFILTANDIDNDKTVSNKDMISQAGMNSIYGRGGIVKQENRTLIVQINVAELYTITMKAVKDEKPDPCLTDRTTTIQNHRNINGDLTNSASLVTRSNDFDSTQTVYTYKGVNNYITVDYNKVMYSKAIFSFDDSISKVGEIDLLGTGAKQVVFTLDNSIVGDDGNVLLKITYVPKPITEFNVTYILDGSVVSAFDSKIFTDTKPKSTMSLYFGESAEYKYELKSADYNVAVTLNGVNVTSNPVKCVVQENTYDSEGFFVIVRLTEVKKDQAVFRFVLKDTSTAHASDNYGDFDVLVGGNVAEKVSDSAGSYYVAIPEKRKVEVDITNLAEGYHFVELDRSTATLSTELKDNKVVVVESFKFSDVNNYNIVIEKDIVQAKLTVTSEYADKYVMTTSGIKTVKISEGVTTIDAYLGKTLSFTFVDEEKEKLGYYYYKDSTGNHEIAKNADNSITLEITSDLLSKLEKVGDVYVLNIGVVTEAKHYLKYNVLNAVYAENDNFVTLDDGVTVYSSGVYMNKGTKLIVGVETKDNVYDVDGTTVKEAKYIITLSGCINETISDGKVNKEIELNANKDLTITLTPKSYKDDTKNEEYIYTSLENYKLMSGAESATGIGEFALSSNMNYGDVATATFKRVSERGELAIIRLSGNDGNSLIVHIDEKQIISIYDETNNIEYLVIEENAKHATGANPATIKKISNLTEQLKTFGYTLNFVSGATERVELSFEVKNSVVILTEYLCYKEIIPLI